MVGKAFDDLVLTLQSSGQPLPRNTGGNDRVDRKLDCAVMRTLHRTHEEAGRLPFDTVRAAFFEGEPLYENEGFASRNHIQVCVRNPSRILGYFRPLGENGLPVPVSSFELRH